MGKHNPEGIHGAIWAELTDEDFALPPDKPLTLASFQAEPGWTAYVEPLAVAECIPDMALLLEEDIGISVPVEETYQATWNVLPEEVRSLLE